MSKKKKRKGKIKKKQNSSGIGLDFFSSPRQVRADSSLRGQSTAVDGLRRHLHYSKLIYVL